MSYNGQIGFGLLGDYDAMPDIDVFADYLEDALAELLQAAGGKRARAPRRATAKTPS